MKKLKALFEQLIELIAPKRTASIGWQYEAERLATQVEELEREVESVAKIRDAKIDAIEKESRQKDLLIKRLVESQISQHTAIIEIQKASHSVDPDFMIKFVKDLNLPTGEALPEWVRKYNGKLYFEETQPIGMPPDGRSAIKAHG